jgi:hypothetical protein
LQRFQARILRGPIQPFEGGFIPSLDATGPLYKGFFLRRRFFLCDESAFSSRFLAEGFCGDGFLKGDIIFRNLNQILNLSDYSVIIHLV